MDKNKTYEVNKQTTPPPYTQEVWDALSSNETQDPLREGINTLLRDTLTPFFTRYWKENKVESLWWRFFGMEDEFKTKWETYNNEDPTKPIMGIEKNITVQQTFDYFIKPWEVLPRKISIHSDYELPEEQTWKQWNLMTRTVTFDTTNHSFYSVSSYCDEADISKPDIVRKDTYDKAIFKQRMELIFKQLARDIKPDTK